MENEIKLAHVCVRESAPKPGPSRALRFETRRIRRKRRAWLCYRGTGAVTESLQGSSRNTGTKAAPHNTPASVQRRCDGPKSKSARNAADPPFSCLLSDLDFSCQSLDTDKMPERLVWLLPNRVHLASAILPGNVPPFPVHPSTHPTIHPSAFHLD